MAGYDLLIVGAGLFGAIVAREATDRGLKVLVLESRDHIGGNCHTEERNGIHVHSYGPHVFHTADRRIWEYMNRWTKFNNFSLRVKVNFRGRLFSFPINLMTLHQLWGVTTPEEAASRIQSEVIPCDHPRNLEDWCLAQVGREVYETFVQGYTVKQWGRDPKELPASIIRRLPIRLNLNDRYYPDSHVYEGIPIGGYTALFHRLLDGIEVRTGHDYLSERLANDRLAHRIVYTGPLDAFFEHREGRLEYRSLRFEHEERQGDFQGNAQVNYTDAAVPYTRIIEHKHFEFLNLPHTVITREYPQEYALGAIPYYPVVDSVNSQLARLYQEAADKIGPRVSIEGRLGKFCYYDMYQVVGSALAWVAKQL